MLSLCSAWLKLHHQNYPEKYCVKHYLGTFTFQILKIIQNSIRIIARLFLLLTLICIRKMSSSHEEYMFSIFLFTIKWCFKRHITFYIIIRLHSIFSLSIFRITLRKSSVFRLSISSLNFDWEICSFHQRTTCFCDFMVKVNENQIDASFIALEIYLKLSNK